MNNPSLLSMPVSHVFSAFLFVFLRTRFMENLLKLINFGFRRDLNLRGVGILTYKFMTKGLEGAWLKEAYSRHDSCGYLTGCTRGIRLSLKEAKFNKWLEIT